MKGITMNRITVDAIIMEKGMTNGIAAHRIISEGAFIDSDEVD